MAEKAATAKNVDFTNVKDGGSFNPSRLPAGDYLATITKVVDAKAKSDDAFQYVFTFKLSKHQSVSYPYYCKLTENQLWKLRNLLIAAGMTVPKKRLKLDPNKVVGKQVGVTLEDDEYEGKPKSVIASVFPAAELMDGGAADDDEDEDTELEDDLDADEESDEEDEEESGDSFDDLDRAALKAFIVSKQADFQAKKSQTDDDLREIARKLEGDEDEDEDEEEEDEPTPPKKAAKPAAKAKGKKAKAEDISDEELEELDIDDL